MWYPNIAQQLDQLGPQGLEIFLRQMLDTLAQITNHEVAFVEVLHEERVLDEAEMKSVLSRKSRYERNVAAYNKVIANGVGRVLVWALYVSENHHVISEIQSQLLAKRPVGKSLASSSAAEAPSLLSSYFGGSDGGSTTTRMPSQNFGSNSTQSPSVSSTPQLSTMMMTARTQIPDWSQTNFSTDIQAPGGSPSLSSSQNNPSSPSMDYDPTVAFSASLSSTSVTTPMTSSSSSSSPQQHNQHQQQQKEDEGTAGWFDSIVDVLMQYQDANFGFEEPNDQGQRSIPYDDISEDGGSFSYSTYLSNSTSNNSHQGHFGGP